jgi:Rrf2 family protein
MKLTRAATYALKAVVYIANKKKEKITTVPSHLIAEESGIPPRFLLKVLKPLVGARVLNSIKGPSGGYSLARPANEITMLEIIEASDNPIRGTVPRDAKDGVSGLQKRLEQVCGQTADMVRKQLGKVKVSELAAAE